MEDVNITVAPLVGAWIEMTRCGNYTVQVNVAPLVGAWIEMDQMEKDLRRQ